MKLLSLSQFYAPKFTRFIFAKFPGYSSTLSHLSMILNCLSNWNKGSTIPLNSWRRIANRYAVNNLIRFSAGKKSTLTCYCVQPYLASDLDSLLNTGVARDGSGAMPPQIVSILCFEKRCPKQNTVPRLKSNILDANCCWILRTVSNAGWIKHERQKREAAKEYNVKISAGSTQG